MKAKTLSCALAMLALAVSSSSEATLLGSTVTVTNSASSGLDDEFLVVDGLERSLCLVPFEGTCLAGINFDVGADYISYLAFNSTVGSPSIVGNVITHVFSGAPTIIGAELVSNTLPTTIGVSFTANSVTFDVGSYIWAAGSVYENRTAITTVPEPGTLLLMSGGLLGMFATATRRLKGTSRS